MLFRSVAARTEGKALAVLADAHRPDVTPLALSAAIPTAEVNA